VFISVLKCLLCFSVYNIARITSRLEVPYYLSDEESVGVDGVDAIDRRVESEYLETLESQCLEERSKIQSKYGYHGYV